MTSSLEDPFDLERFVTAQASSYDDAYAEIQSGQKRSHWMWFVFPQLRGLGHSAMADRYGISSLHEARAYLEHPVLGKRLISISEATLFVNGKSATEIFGKPDDMKLRSCATLFSHISESNSVFHRIIGKYFDGKLDEATLRLLNSAS